MSRHSDTVRDEFQRAIPGVLVYVYDWDFPSDATGGLSVLLDDDGVTPLPNPLTTDQFGQFYFNAPQGEKLVEYHFGGKLLFREQIILAPDGSEPLGLIPAKSTRPGKYLAFDAAGDATVASGTGNDTALRTDIAATTGSSLVGFSSSATYGSGTLGLAIRSRGVHATDAPFLLKGDGSDETTALTAFWNSAIANPGIPHYLPAKTYGFSAALPTINVPNVWIEGVGAEIHDGGTGAQVSGTVLKWLGGAAHSTTGITISPASGTGSQHLSGVFFRYLAIDGNGGNLGTLVSIKSCQESDFDLVPVNAFTAGVVLDVVASLGTGEPRDTQHNKIRINARQVEADGYALVLTGDATANASTNDIAVDAQVKNTPAVHCVNSDNNRWQSVEVYNTGGGTVAYGMDLAGGAAGARGEVIEFYSSSLPIVGRANTTGHVVHHLDKENSTPMPTLEAGAVIAVLSGWQSYTPVVTAATGTITAHTATGSYRLGDGGLLYFTANATITTNGSGAAALQVTLPFAAAPVFAFSASGTERSGTRKALSVDIAPTATFASVAFADGTYPGADGRVISISGSYRVAF